MDFVAESHMDLQNKCQEICLQHSPQTKIWNLPVPDAEDVSFQIVFNLRIEITYFCLKKYTFVQKMLKLFNRNFNKKAYDDCNLKSQ